IKTKIGLTFSSVLRTALRQDPDIMMVGEMRDQETVEIGLRGAITGHLVLSTLHTNDAITSALRLIDMGAAGFLVGSALRAVIAQRLVRRVCDSCAIEYQADEQELFWLTNLVGERAKSAQFMQGKGCQSCQYTGYKGRVGVFEILEMNEGMMAALKRNDSELFGKLAKENPSFTPLAKAAFDYATTGVTTVEEVLRLVETIDIN
ncbi:MAG: ATPase, T2SS/T4P/T4SS family, partial [Colwellia sp.]